MLMWMMLMLNGQRFLFHEGVVALRVPKVGRRSSSRCCSRIINQRRSLFFHQKISTTDDSRRVVRQPLLTSSSLFSSSTASSNSPDQRYQNHLPFNNNDNDVIIGPQLRQHYFALRHGQSLANVAKIIASDPNVACSRHGLSELGKAQAAKAGKDVIRQYHVLSTKAASPEEESTAITKDRSSSTSRIRSSSSDSSNAQPTTGSMGIAIVTSDLLRAKETAEIVANIILQTNNEIPLYGHGPVVDIRLRERRFGEWDGGSDVHYQDVWKDDVMDPFHTNRNVESVWSVTNRVTECVMDWDTKLEEPERNWMVVCVAHGDVLQILQTAFFNMDPSQHRSLDHLETATLRPLTQH